MLRAREGDVERGIPIDRKVGLVTFHEAAEDMLNDYKANRKRTDVDAKRRINKHLAPFLGNKRLSSITASDIRTTSPAPAIALHDLAWLDGDIDLEHDFARSTGERRIRWDA